MKRIIVKQLMLCLALFVSCLIAKAQTVYCYLPDDFIVDAGSTFTADIQVDSFINVGGAGLSLKWDPEVLKYVEVTDYGVELSEFSGINDAKALSDGEFGFSWLSLSATNGVTLADSSVLLSIVFEVIGNAGDTTSLQFTNAPVFGEFSDLQPKVIPSIFTGASVTVTGTSNTYYNSAPDRISLYPPVPNPFFDNTLIKIDLQQAALTDIKIIDQSGRLLYEDQQFFSAGLQSLPISKEIFKQSGTYYCLLNANDFRVMQKLVFIDR